jgi:hypothetical protein
MELADIKAVLMPEFSAMRSEITTFIALEVQFLTVSVTLAGVLVGLAIHDWDRFRESLDICPVPFLVLALLYADTKARVLRAASYIERKLRPQLVAAGFTGSLQWEEFLRNEYPARKHLDLIEKLRWLVFLLPALTAMALSLNMPPRNPGLNLHFYPILLTLDLVLVGFVLWTIFVLVNHDKIL